MSRSPWYWSCSDQTVQLRLDRVRHQPPVAAGTANRKQLAELDQLAEIMIGRASTEQETLKAAIQTEVLRQGPDRSEFLPGWRHD